MWQERDATHASCRSVLVYFLSFFLECQIVRLIIFMIYFPNPRDQCSKVDFSSMCVPLEHWTRGWGFAVFLFYTFRIRKTKKHTHQAEFSLRLFLPHRGPILEIAQNLRRREGDCGNEGGMEKDLGGR